MVDDGAALPVGTVRFVQVYSPVYAPVYTIMYAQVYLVFCNTFVCFP